MLQLYKADYIYYKEKFQTHLSTLVENGVIKEIGEWQAMEAKFAEVELTDMSGKAIVPGTVNAHNHSFQSLLRGIAVDRPFLEWRNNALYKYTPLLDEEAIYIGALFAFGEMLKYGVTTVSDFFYVHDGGTATDEAVIQAAQDLVIRLVLARTMYDWNGAPLSYQETVQDAVHRTRQLAKKYQGNPMVRFIRPLIVRMALLRR